MEAYKSYCVVNIDMIYQTKRFQCLFTQTATELSHATDVTYATCTRPGGTVRLCSLQQKLCSLQPVVVLSVM